MIALRSERVLTPEGLRPRTVVIDGGKITGVVESFSGEVRELGSLVLMPGLVDCHVHVNEPGRTEWEGFETATRAAAKGGITTLVDMPLNSSPVTTSVRALDVKLEATRDKLFVDVGFWGGVVPGNENELEPLARGHRERITRHQRRAHGDDERAEKEGEGQEPAPPGRTACCARLLHEALR